MSKHRKTRAERDDLLAMATAAGVLETRRPRRIKPRHRKPEQYHYDRRMAAFVLTVALLAIGLIVIGTVLINIGIDNAAGYAGMANR